MNIWLAVVALIVLVGIGYGLSQKKSSEVAVNGGGQQTRDQNLYPVTSFTHAHGLAVDPIDPSTVYIATHEGLFLLKKESDLYQIGKSKDDLMGFSVHPTQANTFYSSGHPRTGGNLGVQRSEDGGVTWKKISNGVAGPVDFHAMAISSVNPNIMYGWYGGLQKSTDGGKAWTTLRVSLPDVIALATDPKDEKRVYASTERGLFGSSDAGETWTSISFELETGAVTVFALDPNNPQNALSFSQVRGLARSEDGGKTWKSIRGIDDVIFHIAFDPSTPKRAYLLTKSRALYKTLDDGETWTQIR